MFTIYKHNHKNEEELRYAGEVISRGVDFVCVKAIFQAPTVDLGYVVFKRGDHFTEWFYSNRWYNVFKIEDVDTGTLKGYYCNVTRPATITQDTIRADDLALDVFVKPSGEILVLDEDEFQELELREREVQQANAAVSEIRQLVQQKQTPFHDLKNNRERGQES